MNDLKESDVGSEILHSKKIMASYGFGSLIWHLVDLTLIFMLFFFYEVEVGLESWLTGLGLSIFAVWDACNDPIVGYLTDRPFRFTKKWGRRFPWVIMSFIPMLISFILIFTPPNVSAQESPWIIFGWLVFSTCLYDTLESIFTVNFWSLFPDKFRDRTERRVASSFIVYLGFVGLVISFIVPPMIIVYGDLGSYAMIAWFCVVVSFFCWIIMIPGVRDDKEAVKRYLTKYEEREKDSFFKVLKETLKQKTFVICLTLFVLFESLTVIMTSSFLYFVRYILQEEAEIITLISIMLLIGGLIGVPIWYKYAQKTHDNRKTMIISGLIMICFTLPLTVISDLTGILVDILLYGIGLGGFWVMIDPVFGDIIDESIIITGKRREGMFFGFRNFICNFAKVIGAITLAIVHELTGFVEGAEIQPPTALFGIHLHFGLIPAIYLAIGIFVFWKYFDITPEKAKQIKEQLMELKT